MLNYYLTASSQISHLSDHRLYVFLQLHAHIYLQQNFNIRLLLIMVFFKYIFSVNVNTCTCIAIMADSYICNAVFNALRIHVAFNGHVDVIMQMFLHWRLVPVFVFVSIQVIPWNFEQMENETTSVIVRHQSQFSHDYFVVRLTIQLYTSTTCRN